MCVEDVEPGIVCVGEEGEDVSVACVVHLLKREIINKDFWPEYLRLKLVIFGNFQQIPIILRIICKFSSF